MSKHSDLHSFLINKNKPSKQVLFLPILMQFTARLNDCTYTEFMTDYKVLVESNIKCLELIDHDAVGLISDPFRETSAFCGKIEFFGNHNPVCDPIFLNMNDIENLKNPNVYKSERTYDRIMAGKYYQKLLDNDIPIIGWIECPLAEAANLAGVNNILFKLLMESDFACMLMDIYIITAKDFAKAQVEAGCLVIGIGDAICSQIDPETYHTFVLPLHQEIIEYIHSLGAFTKLHICGDITHLLPELALTGIDILDLDWMVSFNTTREKCGDNMILCGNLDPVSIIQEKSAEEVKKRSQQLMEDQNYSRFILSGGCETTRDTPLENLIAMKYAIN